jgi:pilus assembly protein FimV
MHAASTLTVIGTALWLASVPAHAVGFGRVSNATQLGQPLSFVATVRLDPDEILPRECVSAEVQSGENKLHPSQIRVALEGAADATERSVRVTTNALIDEPVVTVSITLGCDARVTRRFVAFIDPPLINAAQTAPVEPPPQQQRVESQVAPITAMVQSANAPASRLRRSDRSVPARSSTRAPSSAPARAVAADSIDAAPAASEKPKRPITRQPNLARATPSGSRLQLEAAAPVVGRSASVAPASTPPPVLVATAPASAPKPDDTAELLAKERQRMQTVEDGLAKLRADSQTTQAALVALQARLKAAEDERYANPLVYALAWLSALLALAVAGLWWRQSRARHAAHWWAGPAPAPVASSAPLTAAAAAVEPVASAPAPLSLPQTTVDVFDVSTVVDEDEAPSHAPTARERPRELSVEELIDLEQQAEFFIVLGQDEAAIELLMSHVRSDGGNSPLPYLKLLEIYRRRGDGDAYQRIRERFNRRFNSYAPDWDSDLQQGRSLVDYPDTIAQLQQLWSSPVRAMGTLDASLFRRNKTDETFDLPAYRELLFLYSIARDLAEHDGALPNTHVDLLLPLDDPGEEPISRLSANTKSGDFQASALTTMPLDLDVSSAPGSAHGPETAPSAQRRPAEPKVDSIFIDFDLGTPAKAPKSGNR